MSEERRRPRVMWFALPWLAISLPLLVALRLRFEFAYDTEATVDGALALADYGGPYLALLGLWFGVRPRRADDLPPVLDQGARPMLAMLVATFVAMGLLVPPDFVATTGPWRRVLAWLAAAALPAWSVALLLRERGGGRILAALSAGMLVALLGASSIAAGALLLLDPWAQLLPLTAAGAIASFGLVLAAWERVTAPTGRVLMATTLAAITIAVGSAWRIAHPPMYSGSITSVEAIDGGGQRATVAVRWPNVAPVSMIELDLATGDWTPLPPLTRQVRYAAGVRVASRLGRLSHALGRRGPALLCRESPGAPGGDVCGPETPSWRGTIITPHNRLPQVLASWRDRFVRWDLEQTEWTEVLREGETLRWPCFDASGGVIWRLLQADGPYLHERLTPEGDVVPLELGHRYQCIEGIPVEPVARFERGRVRLGRPSRLFGPALPEEGFDLPGVVQQAQWSPNGQALALHILEDERYVVRFWTADRGLGDPIPAAGVSNLLLSQDGTRAAWPVSTGLHRHRYEVRDVPSGRLLDRGPIHSTTLFFGPDRRLLLHRDGQLIWRDPVSQTSTVLFPTD